MTEPYEVGIVLPFDLHEDRITVAEAAELVFGWTDDKRLRRRWQAVVRKWAARGHLAIQDHDGPWNGPRFLGIHVLQAEAKTRERARRAG